MTTESLIVELDAKTGELDAGLKSTNDELDRLTKQVEKSDDKLSDWTKTAKKGGAIAFKLAGSYLAVSAAVSAMVLSSASSRKELELLSLQAKQNVDDFQAIAFATNTVRIDAEKFADVSKDISDRMGEFATAATGPFQDYADVMKLSKEETIKTAKEFQKMNSEDVLIAMIKNMEDAGTTGDQMIFVMESLAGDASRLIPLFKNNAEQLNNLKKSFKDVNDELKITDKQAEGLKEVSTKYNLMTTQIGNATTAISATLAPVMTDFFNDVIEIVPQATQTIINFINTFLDAEDIQVISQIDEQLKSVNKTMRETALASKIVNEAIESGDTGFFSRERNIGMILRAEEFETAKKRAHELEAQLFRLKEAQADIGDAVILEGGEIGGEGGESASTGKTDADLVKELDVLQLRLSKIEEMNMTEIELLTAKLGEEKELLDQTVTDEEERNSFKLLLDEEYANNKQKIDQKALDSEVKISKMRMSLASSVAGTLLSQSMSTSEKLFSIVKDVAASQIQAYGLTAGAKALAELGPIAGPPAAASVIGWSQVAAGIVKSLPLGGSGGGGSPSSSNSSTVAQQDFQQETSSQEVSTTTISDDGSSSGVQEIRFVSDGGSPAEQLFVDMQNEAVKRNAVEVSR